MILKKIHLMAFRPVAFGSTGTLLSQTPPVCARDPSLRLKNGSVQDDAAEEMKFSRLPACTATRDSID